MQLLQEGVQRRSMRVVASQIEQLVHQVQEKEQEPEESDQTMRYYGHDCGHFDPKSKQ